MSDQVAIVGASVSGLYAAYLLAKRGRPVRVYEAAEELEPLERSLIVTSAYRDLLGELGEPAVRREINTFELFSNGRAAEVRLDRPDLVIERAGLVRSLAEAARAQGAEIRFGRRLDGLEPAANGLALRFRGDETVAAGAVVGADGARSVVAERGGWPRCPLVPVVQAIVRLPDDMARDSTRVWFVPEETPYFYWLIPHSDSHGALGMIGVSRASARRLLDGFTRRRGLVVDSYQGALIPEYRRWIPVRRKLGGGEVFLVGDAAAHVKVTTVGGIVDGLWGAEGVCERLASNGARPRRSLAGLRVELELHRAIRRVLHGFGEAEYCALLEQLGSRGRETLGAFTRDDTLRLMLRLALRRPSIVWLGLRQLLRGARRPA